MSRMFVLIKKITAINVTALSSPISIGFPAITSVGGFVESLNFKIHKSDKFQDVNLIKFAVINNSLDLKTYKDSKMYVASLIGKRTPLNGFGKSEGFVEIPKCNTVNSVLIEIENLSYFDVPEFLKCLNLALFKSKFCGGDICNIEDVEILIEDENDKREMLKHVGVGFAVVQSDIECSSVDDFIDNTSVQHHYIDGEWVSTKKSYGVPISVGFKTITPIFDAGYVKNTRDSTKKHTFLTSIVKLCEFRFPLAFKTIDDILWNYHVETGEGNSVNYIFSN